MKSINLLALIFLLSHYSISNGSFLSKNQSTVLEQKKTVTQEENIKFKNNHRKINPSKLSFKKNDTSMSQEDIPVFLGGIKPLSENQKSPTFMPIEKGATTTKAPNGESFDSLNYTKVNNIKVHLKNESQAEVPAGYYGESRITYYF